MKSLVRAPCLLRVILLVSSKPHFACGFHFRHSPRLPFAAVLSVLKELIVVPVGTKGSFSPGDNSFDTVKGLVDYV